MIDTIRLAYPLNPYLKSLVDTRSTRLMKLSPSGEVVWDKGFCQDDLPSHFSGLRIYVQESSALLKAGFRGARSEVFFEFSLHKYLSETGYNNRNMPLDTAMSGLDTWITAAGCELGFAFNPESFRPQRVDLARNHHLINGALTDFLRCSEIKLSRYNHADEKLHKYPGCLFYGSSWMGKKIYDKYAEFMDVERKKRKTHYNDGFIAGETSELKGCDFEGKRGLTFEEIRDMKNMARFEVGFKASYLKRHGVEKIVSIPKLLAAFHEQEKKFLTVERLKAGVSLSILESFTVDLVKRHGKDAAKLEFLKQRSLRSWYRVQRDLLCKGIDLDCILNEDYRGEIARIDNLKHFEFRLAA